MVTPNFLFGYQEHLLRSAIPAQYLFSEKPRKNIRVLVGTTHRKPEYLRPSRHAQNVCAVTIGGTVHRQPDISRQEKNFEIQLPSGPVHFSFQLPPLKYYLPNRRRENNVHALSATLAFYLNWTMMKRN